MISVLNVYRFPRKGPEKAEARRRALDDARLNRYQVRADTDPAIRAAIRDEQRPHDENDE